MGKYPREYVTVTVSQNPTTGGQGEGATPLGARKGTDIILFPRRQEVVGLVRGLVSQREQVYTIPHVSHTCNKQKLGPRGVNQNIK